MTQTIAFSTDVWNDPTTRHAFVEQLVALTNSTRESHRHYDLRKPSPIRVTDVEEVVKPKIRGGIDIESQVLRITFEANMPPKPGDSVILPYKKFRGQRFGSPLDWLMGGTIPFMVFGVTEQKQEKDSDQKHIHSETCTHGVSSQPNVKRAVLMAHAVAPKTYEAYAVWHTHGHHHPIGHPEPEKPPKPPSWLDKIDGLLGHHHGGGHTAHVEAQRTRDRHSPGGCDGHHH